MSRDARNANTLQTRLDPADHSRLLALAEAMSARAGGLPLNRSVVCRVCILRGLEAYEHDFRLGPRRRHRRRKRSK